MKRSTRPSRTPAKLPDSTLQRLNMYALAASAAGVGMLALALPAEAKIVYTKTHRLIPNGKEIFLDLNHDGINDFGLFVTYNQFARTYMFSLELDARNNSFFLGTITKRAFCAAALPRGVKVGPKARLHSGKGVMYSYTRVSNTFMTHSCAWKWGKTAYLGLKFGIKGKTHFGWARVQSIQRGSSILLGYAYETVPNRPIVTGKTRGPDEVSPDNTTAVNGPAKPATLGVLATGAPRLSIWRRKESEASMP
jgi:hypothetical protein